ncbi:MAG: hypothetical protein HOK21_03150 [Rhodospirillaceae bacterium]|nr:hypothetical protein [Rhodospirillaceae bacterium]MBT4688711.1 hypothetical protein [Rhodospirillaceae bacterium]MBT5080945.1 hypothetical protein [Rhodospirillaceae bacterium]MBT5523058.1 hypothetical protein [Rhodospirillaceae bacterium]MBT5881710.1 hypothetical protein [Rhodospirillaceae bacterium]
MQESSSVEPLQFDDNNAVPVLFSRKDKSIPGLFAAGDLLGADWDDWAWCGEDGIKTIQHSVREQIHRNFAG